MLELSPELRQLLRTIITTTPSLQDEVDVFDLECADLWTRFLNGSPPGESLTAENKEDFEFGGSAVAFLQVVALLWGTFKMLDDLKQRFANHKRRQTEVHGELLHKWTQHLIQAGLSSEVAKDIVETHGVRAAEAALVMLSKS